MADSSHPNFKMIRDAIKAKDWDLVPTLFEVAKAVEVWSQDQYVLKDDVVLYKGKPLPPSLSRRVLQFFADGTPFEPLLKFHSRLQANPSYRSVEELFDFLENKNIPIDEDGFFYAYKAVNQNWTDIYSGKVSNHIGAKPSMPRNEVDDNRHQHCSFGYHVGALEYVRWYKRGDSRVLICKVDPADVVSVPADHNCQKVRVTTYEVVSEYTGPLPEGLYSTRSRDEDYDDEDVRGWENEFDEDEGWHDDEDDCDFDDEEDDEDSEEVPSEKTFRVIHPNPVGEPTIEIHKIPTLVQPQTPIGAVSPAPGYTCSPPVSSETVEVQDKKIELAAKTLEQLLYMLRYES